MRAVELVYHAYSIHKSAPIKNTKWLFFHFVPFRSVTTISYDYLTPD